MEAAGLAGDIDVFLLTCFVPSTCAPPFAKATEGRQDRFDGKDTLGSAVGG